MIDTTIIITIIIVLIMIDNQASFDANGTAIYNNRRTVTSSDRTLINAFRLFLLIILLNLIKCLQTGLSGIIFSFLNQSSPRTIAEMSDRINLPRNIIDRANTLFKVSQLPLRRCTCLSEDTLASFKRYTCLSLEISILRWFTTGRA